MSNFPKDIYETETLVETLTGRYGALALSRTAGEAAAAERHGDMKRSLHLRGVISDLRHILANDKTSL